MRYMIILLLFLVSCSDDEATLQEKVNDFENPELSEEQKIAAFLVGEWEVVGLESDHKVKISMTEDTFLMTTPDLTLKGEYELASYSYDYSYCGWMVAGIVFEYDVDSSDKDNSGDPFEDPLDDSSGKEQAPYKLHFINDNSIVLMPTGAKLPSAKWKRVSKAPSGAENYVKRIKADIEASRQKVEEKRAMGMNLSIDGGLSGESIVRMFRYLTKDGKTFVYLEPGGFKGEATVEKIGKNTFRVHLKEHIEYARMLLELPEKDSLSFTVKTGSRRRIIELKAEE